MKVSQWEFKGWHIKNNLRWGVHFSILSWLEYQVSESKHSSNCHVLSFFDKARFLLLNRSSIDCKSVKVVPDFFKKNSKNSVELCSSTKTSEDRQSSDFWFLSRSHDSLLDSFKFEDGLGTFTVFTNDGKNNGTVHADAKMVF